MERKSSWWCLLKLRGLPSDHTRKSAVKQARNRAQQHSSCTPLPPVLVF